MFFLLVTSLIAGPTSEPPTYSCGNPCEPPLTELDCQQPCPCADSCRTNSINFTGSFLYWQPHEDGLDYVYKNESGNAFLNNNGSARRIEFEYQPGFRVGLGYQPNWLPHIDASWTHYNSKGDDRAEATFPEALFSVWTIPGANITAATNAKATWWLNLNEIDLLFSIPFKPTTYARFTPFFGASNTWVRQKMHINLNGGTSTGGAALVVLNDDIDMKNNFWGIGPKLGMKTFWEWGKGFGLFGDGAFSILFGKFDIDQSEQVTFAGLTPPTVYLNLQDDCYYLARTVLDFNIGLRWETTGHNEAFRFLIEASWENLFYFGQNQLKRFVDDSHPGINVSTEGDLTLHGLSLKAALAF